MAASHFRRERLEKFAAVLRFRKVYHTRTATETTDPVESKNNRLLAREYDKLLQEFMNEFGLEEPKE